MPVGLKASACRCGQGWRGVAGKTNERPKEESGGGTCTPPEPITSYSGFLNLRAANATPHLFFHCTLRQRWVEMDNIQSSTKFDEELRANNKMLQLTPRRAAEMREKARKRMAALIPGLARRHRQKVRAEAGALAEASQRARESDRRYRERNAEFIALKQRIRRAWVRQGPRRQQQQGQGDGELRNELDAITALLALAEATAE
ncbi:hypothetical protein GGX14DRAFT_399967 [Mycena pura]|uniref:Uncharacterized protein n=1 Tax=Mycena pura TaxID=153505 RepID=A0AAD6VAL1_9AGAR|nr:hypothetical protein GGX14DRAFT_399967 [Mycena pura]